MTLEMLDTYISLSSQTNISLVLGEVQEYKWDGDCNFTAWLDVTVFKVGKKGIFHFETEVDLY